MHSSLSEAASADSGAVTQSTIIIGVIKAVEPGVLLLRLSVLGIYALARQVMRRATEHSRCHHAGVTTGPPADYTIEGDAVPKMFNAFNGLGIMVMHATCFASAATASQLKYPVHHVFPQTLCCKSLD